MHDVWIIKYSSSFSGLFTYHTPLWNESAYQIQNIDLFHQFRLNWNFIIYEFLFSCCCCSRALGISRPFHVYFRMEKKERKIEKKYLNYRKWHEICKRENLKPLRRTQFTINVTNVFIKGAGGGLFSLSLTLNVCHRCHVEVQVYRYSVWMMSI